jgi:anti-anti-sigma factor
MKQKNLDACYLTIDAKAMSQITYNNQYEKFIDQITKSNSKVIMLDLTDIDFLNSSGIVLIVKLYKYCKKTEKQFCIAHVRQQAKDLLRCVNLHTVIPMID